MNGTVRCVLKYGRNGSRYAGSPLRGSRSSGTKPSWLKRLSVSGRARKARKRLASAMCGERALTPRPSARPAGISRLLGGSAAGKGKMPMSAPGAAASTNGIRAATVTAIAASPRATRASWRSIVVPFGFGWKQPRSDSSM